jgi:hypothetical protein
LNLNWRVIVRGRSRHSDNIHSSHLESRVE